MIPQNRIYHLDVLRGLAVLGILMMNLPEFAMHPLQMSNANWYEAPGSLNYRVWEVIYIFFEGKMRGILSVTFGVSILLFTRKDHAQSSLPMADAYFRRMFWLLFFSAFFSFILLSSTTILYEYAYCGILLFVFRNANYKWLLSLSLVFLLLHSIKGGANFMHSRPIAVNYYAAVEKKERGEKLDSADIKAVKAWTEWQGDVKKQVGEIPGMVVQDLHTYHSGYPVIFEKEAGELAEGYTTFGIADIMETIGTVLLGMALFKTRFLRAEMKAKSYLVIALILLAAGTVIGYIRFKTQLIANSDFTGRSLVTRHFSTAHIEQFHRLSFVFGYISFFIYFCKTNFFKKLLYPLECVGKMAISNYVFQNFSCTLIFYGYGLDLYNSLERWQLVLVMAFIWTVQITFSIIWLRYFTLGPLEWCWRSLIYWKRQPLRLGKASA
jgi:uncharacterized protein